MSQFKLFILSSLVFYLFFLPQSTFAENTILINEFLANQKTGENEWIEVYNPDDADLLEYWIDDDDDFLNDTNNTSKKKLSSLDLSYSGLFTVLNLSSPMFNDTCSSVCDSVVLFSPEGALVDKYQYTTEQIKKEGKSIGRSPDASGNWVVLATITKGSPNSPAEPTPTPSPSPTPTPTKSPTPTKTPTPTPTSKPTPMSKPTITSSFSPIQKLAGESGEALLVESLTSSSTPTATNKPSGNPSPTSSSKVLGASQNNLSKILIGLGVVLLAACGILAFRKLKIKN